MNLPGLGRTILLACLGMGGERRRAIKDAGSLRPARILVKMKPIVGSGLETGGSAPVVL